MTSLTFCLIALSAVFLALLSAMMVISITQTRDVCQLDIKTKAQFNKLPPMLLTFGADVLKAKKAIIVSVFYKSLRYNVFHFDTALPLNQMVIIDNN